MIPRREQLAVLVLDLVADRCGRHRADRIAVSRPDPVDGGRGAAEPAGQLGLQDRPGPTVNAAFSVSNTTSRLERP
jgi:hypothetical protein